MKYELALVLLILINCVNAEDCDWKWVIEMTLKNNVPQAYKDSVIQSMPETSSVPSKVCATNPPTLEKLQRSQSAARTIMNGDHNITKFAYQMRQIGWEEDIPLYHVLWKNGTVHSSIKGDYFIGDGETLAAVVSIMDSTGSVQRWEGWNINVIPPFDMQMERNSYINTKTREPSLIDTLEGNITIESV